MPSRSNSFRRARPLLGTFVEIEVRGLGENAAHRAIDAAFDVIAEVQRRMSYHDPESVLSRVNREAAERAVEVDAWTFEVLSVAAEVHRVSGGVFDVTIAPRLEALGFLPGERSEAVGKVAWTSVQTPVELGLKSKLLSRAASRRRARSAIPTRASFADVELLAENRVRFHRPGLRLDLGGIAKGFAVDQAVAVLQRSGVPGGLVNAGGDLRAIGGEPFPVAIRHPDDPRSTLTTVALQNAALATSAHYFAERLVPGSTTGPIIDPQTGTQARRIRTASVRAASAMLADALTKVVMLAGEAALPVLTHFHADAIFVATDSEARCSPDWSCNAPAFA